MPGMKLGRRRQGSASSGSFPTSGRSAFDLDNEALSAGRSGTATSSTYLVNTNEEDEFEFELPPSPQRSSTAGARMSGALSLGDIRSIVMSSGSKMPHLEKAWPPRIPERTRVTTAPSPSLTFERSAPLPSSKKAPPVVLGGVANSESRSQNAQRQAKVRKAAADASRQRMMRWRMRSSEKREGNERRARPTTDKETTPTGIGADDGVGSAGEAETDDIGAEEDDEEDWGGGDESLEQAQHGKVLKKGKKGSYLNPFVEFEDREQRLMWERRWLKDDELYMRERMRGMRLDSVQARLEKTAISDDILFEDAVYFGAYSCGLRTVQQKKADLRKVSEPLPPLRKRADTAIETMEAEQQNLKTKKGQGDKTLATKDVISLKSMQAVLQESGRIAGQSFAS